MRASLAILAAALLAFTGCISQDDLATANVADAGKAKAFDTSRGWSTPLSPALYTVMEPTKAFVASFDGVEMAVGVFLPEMPGCDWAAANVSDACKIPVVMDAGPYYGTSVAVEKFRPPITEWLVPRGYAVAQMSLRGTGESGGCLDFKSPTDVQDISAVIDWLAAQTWSDGNVGMMGRSYDGTSAWAGAASGNPHLKAIVPISGAVNGPFLYYKNGTTETRGPINGATYFPTYSTDANRPAQERLCKASLVDSHAESIPAAATGDASSAYWQARDLRARILENYQGAVWVIHGLEDWNVNPSQTVPFIAPMQDAGIDVKAWLGVWGHAYPDRVDEHRNVRWDWAEHVVTYFDKHLKMLDVDTGPAIEVEDSLFVWRAETTYPPADIMWDELALGSAGTLSTPENASSGTRMLLADQVLSWRTAEAFDTNVRIAGFPQLHVSVTPTTAAGGHIFAELFDIYPDGREVRIGWAAMNVRYHAGGNTEPATLVPGTPVVALMEFEPMDAHIGAGHHLRVTLHRNGVEDIMQSPSMEPLVVNGGDLRMPTIVRDGFLPTYSAPGL